MHSSYHGQFTDYARDILMYNRIGGFSPDKSRNNFLHSQTMASAILFESRTTILATVQHNWQCISWLYILILQNNTMLKDTQLFRSKMGAFRCIHIHATCLASCLDKVKFGLIVYCALIG